MLRGGGHTARAICFRTYFVRSAKELLQSRCAASEILTREMKTRLIELSKLGE